MKPASNSSFPRVDYLEAAATRVTARGLSVPGPVWLAMVIIAALAISVSTALRAREHAQTAQASYQQTAARVKQLQIENEQIRARVKQLRENPSANEQAVREQLKYVGQNEVAVKVR